MPPKSVVKLVEFDQNDVPGPLLVRRHPQEAVELPAASLGEGMRTLEVDRLPRKHLDGARASRQLIVRQMRMEVEGRDVLQEAKAVEVVEGRSGAISFVPFTTAGRRP